MSGSTVDERGRAAAAAVRDEVSAWVDPVRSFHQLESRVAGGARRDRRHVGALVGACAVVLVTVLVAVAVFAIDDDAPVEVREDQGAPTVADAYAFVPERLPEGFRPVTKLQLGATYSSTTTTTLLPPGADPPIVRYARAYGDVPSLSVRVNDTDHSRLKGKVTRAKVRGNDAEIGGFRDRFHEPELTLRWVEGGRVVIMNSTGLSRERLVEIARHVTPVDRTEFEQSIANVPIDPNGSAFFYGPPSPADPFGVGLDGELLASELVEAGNYAGGQFELRLRSPTSTDGTRWTCLSSVTRAPTGGGSSGGACAEPQHGFPAPQLLYGNEGDWRFIAVSRDRATAEVEVRLNDGRTVVAQVHDTGEGERPLLFLADLGDNPLRPGGTIVATDRRGKVLERWRFGPSK